MPGDLLVLRLRFRSEKPKLPQGKPVGFFVQLTQLPSLERRSISL